MAPSIARIDRDAVRVRDGRTGRDSTRVDVALDDEGDRGELFGQVLRWQRSSQDADVPDDVTMATGC